MRLDSRTALVTGSTDGLGLAIVKALAAAGCKVVMNGLADAAVVEETRRAVEEEHGVTALYRRADLADPAEIERLIGHAEAELGGVDILVNNAVVRHFSPIDTFRADHWDRAIAVNVSAPFHAIRRVLPGMRRRDYGRIFNMVSVYGLRGTRDRIDYVASKSALIGMTRAVAMETLDHDVTCHAICPGSILSPGTEPRIQGLMVSNGGSRANAERAFLQNKQPTGRFVETASVSDLMLLLCGPAGRDMTGSVLPVDGGWLAAG
ncbi:MAG: SDR family NAD(P)-dependent oxidoreductase [Rhizobiaceae bacterium]